MAEPMLKGSVIDGGGPVAGETIPLPNPRQNGAPDFVAAEQFHERANPATGAPPPHNNNINNNGWQHVHKDKTASPCLAFGCLSWGCLEPPETPLGKARRTTCGFIVTPFIWGGWIILIINIITVAGYSIFTPANEYWWLLFILYVLFLASIVCLGLAQGVDPGVVPRGIRHPDFPKSPNVVGSHVNTVVNGLHINAEDYVGLVAGDQLVVWRWCNTCGIHRPPRAAHCSNCGWCVKEYDHHCPVVGSCVAERTYRYFTLLLITLCAQCAVIFISSVYFIATHDWSDSSSGMPLMATFSIVSSAIVSCIGGCWTLGMASSYVCFACRSITLREEVRGLVKPGKRSGPSVTNCVTRLCGKQSESLLPR
eukprot:TRINITY_DN12261_c2_g2_i1.p1 TRINITY_DN12261_c2_g2~~TRINITY_DN12261_c2_g2_i1.p1  ORF type:complete len:367 (+),score=28.60 TRINITY_DN12261_c2_g2_i1:67-1167(+)